MRLWLFAAMDDTFNLPLTMSSMSANLCSVIAFVLLLCSRIPNSTCMTTSVTDKSEYYSSAFDSWSIYVDAPTDHAALGGSLHFAFHLSRHYFVAIGEGFTRDISTGNKSEYQSGSMKKLRAEPQVVNFPMRILINGVSVHSSQLQSTYFECVLLSSLFTPNASNYLKVEVVVDSRYKIDRAVSATVTVKILPPASDPALSAIIDVTKSQPNNRKLFSYLFAGFSYCSLMEFSHVDPLRVELFVSHVDNMHSNRNSNSNCSENNSLTWTTAKIVHDWKQDYANIQNIASYDVGFFMLDGIVEVLCRSGGDCSQLVIQFLLSATQRARASLWLFSTMHTRGNTPLLGVDKIIHSLVNVLLYDEVHIKFEMDRSKPQSDIESKRIHVWANLLPSNVNRIAQWDAYVRNKSHSHSQLSVGEESMSVDGTAAVLSDSGLGTPKHRELPLSSSIIDENYDVGDSYVLLRNACIGRRYTSEQLSKQGLGDLFVVYFEQDSSEDLQWNGIPNIFGGEDKGFDYVGLDIAKIGVRHNASQHMQARWTWMEGLTALATSASSSHIHHELEPLLKFIYLAGIDRSLMSKPGLSQFLNNSITRLVLGKHSSQSGIDWLESMIGLIMGFYETSLSDRKISAPAVYSFDTLFPANSPTLAQDTGDVITNGLCFDQLLLLGRTNSHVKFFDSEMNAQRFKRYLYAAVNISSASSLPIRESHGRVEELLRVSPRYRQLKVTIIIRNGRNRRIVNIQALQELLLGLDNNYIKPPIRLVDETWLLSHVVLLETLTFREQVQLFADTDIAISVHGAAVTNAIFMRHGSAWIDLFNANYHEFIFSPLFRNTGIGGFYLLITNHTLQTSDCSPNTPDWCTHALQQSLDCVSIRQCSFTVDLHRFRFLFSEAYNHVLSVKWIGNSSNKL